MKLTQNVLRCKYCNLEMDCGYTSWLENPFCKCCLNERIEKAAAELGPMVVVREGKFLHLVPVDYQI